MIAQTNVAGVPVVTPGEAIDVLEGDGDGGLLPGTPLLVVNVDDRRAQDLAAIARRVPRVVVGVGSLPAVLASPPDLDVLLTEVDDAPRPWRSCPEGIDRALSTLSLSVACAPRAATTLVQTLRIGRDLALGDALVAESLAYSLLLTGSEFADWLASHEQPPVTSNGEAPVEVARADARLTVRLNRPQVHNTIDGATRDALVGAFDMAARDATIDCVDLRGVGPDFCGGGDLAELGTMPEVVATHMTRTGRNPVQALARCADRTTAHVHGDCIGAGVELAALAGRAVAASDASFRLPELGMGLIPGSGGTVTIPRRIGRQRTAWMALTGAPVDVETALDWGLVDIA